MTFSFFIATFFFLFYFFVAFYLYTEFGGGTKLPLKEYSGSSTSEAQSTKMNFHLSLHFFKNSKNLNCNGTFTKEVNGENP